MQDYMENFEKMKRLMLGFSAFQTLVAGEKLKLFQLLSDYPGIDRKKVAENLKLSEHAARIMLLATCTYGLTERKDGKYFNTSMADQFLTEKSIFPIANFTKYNDVVQYKAFQYLAESLKADTNVGLQTIPGEGNSLYKRLAQSPELERIFQDAMAPKDRNSRSFYFDAKEFGDVKHLLDVGGGPGLIASLLKKENPQIKITIFDLPTVCERAQATFKEEGFSADLDVHPGDFFTDPFPSGVDAIQFSHLLEIFSEDKIVFLMKKAYDALPKGGKLIVYGMGCDDEESGHNADMAAWGSLYFFLLASGEGMMYPCADYRRWMKEAGFSSVIERRNEFENIFVMATK
ncbi:methyltransferase [Massilia sp. BJB1822]|uniref:methyltransferase n=1 Tax=Massilia sp. BJB1822 TaxID=2744470 RepID=UPI0015931EB5|nr:methyltransferase [Massilia sp. BJB1822]NVE01775.1 methyltransferase domain-containing protein [Massilia sp. BJB1822]